ncbi:hypothetical protein G7058_03905 [Jeotgalibaca porci]|uniref:Uncharacterized protein n=1 Tax=Jeotgalibaca porci TaxID=1868793 RepID=A0A6G7WGD8_9LACT|nr:hypothetical protein [Jeotgalibaca porci]QIK51277.1 hypothetical protein G7058_03905 [Jeotgalibaca porci]
MTKQNEMTETVLTVDELKRMGDILSDMRETIELYNHALNLVPHAGQLNPGELAVRYQALYDLTDTMFNRNQQIMRDLNEISFTLAENDDAFEIENTRKKFN